MKKGMIMEFISGSLILLFIYAAFSKLFDLETFSGDLHNQPFPRPLASFLVWGLPGIELLIAGGLLSERTRKAALLSSFLLLTLFTLYIAAILLHFSPRVPCSCGGVIKRLNWNQHLWFNLFFLALSLWGFFLQKRIIFHHHVNHFL